MKIFDKANQKLNSLTFCLVKFNTDSMSIYYKDVAGSTAIRMVIDKDFFSEYDFEELEKYYALTDLTSAFSVSLKTDDEITFSIDENKLRGVSSKIKLYIPERDPDTEIETERLDNFLENGELPTRLIIAKGSLAKPVELGNKFLNGKLGYVRIHNAETIEYSFINNEDVTGYEQEVDILSVITKDEDDYYTAYDLDVFLALGVLNSQFFTSMSYGDGMPLILHFTDEVGHIIVDAILSPMEEDTNE